ncbi:MULTISPECIES: MmcQ/YjbR family DNA-binding protein [unclassified Streptomyces]|uniref:MmcQ/YjbR family DNA-binding protein n=1 Tax=unclassified Streptomyces TaxID=2593676 RepID=UPI003D8C0093
MHADRTVQNRAAACAAELPGSEHTHQFTGDWEVWKVGGKVFMLQTSMPGEPVVILKADPSDAEALRASHTSISRGYHMNKKHWITVRPGADIEQALVDACSAAARTLSPPPPCWPPGPAATCPRTPPRRRSRGWCQP